MKSGLFTKTESSAVFSEDSLQAYRYVLKRVWGTGKMLTWVMLNPSTAGHTNNDPTTLKCRQFSTAFGYGGMYLVNLFGYRASQPDVICALAKEGTTDIVGPLNDRYLLDFAKQADGVVCAWGIHGILQKRNEAVFKLLVDAGIQPYCLGKTKNNQPLHPLWAKADSLRPLLDVQPPVAA
jgi:hypothetical protein